MLGRGYVMFDMLTGSAFWIVANHIQQNCFRAADSYWDNQETPHILWNLGFCTVFARAYHFTEPDESSP